MKLGLNSWLVFGRIFVDEMWVNSWRQYHINKEIYMINKICYTKKCNQLLNIGIYWI